VTLAFGRRTRFSASAGYDRIDFSRQQDDERDFQSSSFSVQVGRSLRRNFGMDAQFEHRRGDFGFSGSTSEQRVRIGADYSRAFSRGRRALVRVNVTSSSMDLGRTASDEVPRGRSYRTLADLSAEYTIRRTWRAFGSVSRTVEHVALLTEPVVSNSTYVGVSGLLRRRVDLAARAGYVTTNSVADSDRQLDSYTGNVRIRFAATRSLALYGEYVYFSYDLAQYQRVASDLPSSFNQHGIRIGLMVWGSAL
jgi:hypothetical protein